MAHDQLERCDVAVLVVDARMAATAEDAKLAGEIEASGRCAIVVLNKKDLVGRADMDKQIEITRETLSFLRYAPVLVTSAVTRAGVTGIVTEAARVFEAKRRSVFRTAELNKLLEDIIATHPPPAGPNGRHVRLYYATQAGVRPPTFFVSTNHPTDITHAYRRFLINQLRKAHGFDGTPIKLRLPRPQRKAPGASKPAKEKIKRG